MSLVPVKDLMVDAGKHKYAVGYFRKSVKYNRLII